MANYNVTLQTGLGKSGFATFSATNGDGLYSTDPLEVQIVSSRGSEFLLLDPFTLQTVEAISPKDWEGKSVNALRYGNDTFFVWE